MLKGLLGCGGARGADVLLYAFRLALGPRASFMVSSVLKADESLRTADDLRGDASEAKDE